jgi:hypothetical protein
MEGGELQQLEGGVQKIFNDMDTSQIFADAANAYKNLNMSANQYLATINDVGAAFSATMGDEKGYLTAKTGLQAVWGREKRCTITKWKSAGSTPPG